MSLIFSLATDADVSALAAVRNAAAANLTRLHGHGPWSSAVTEKAVNRAIEDSQVLVARHAGEIVGTLRLVNRKPWSIDIAYFATSLRPSYVLDMAVEPGHQRKRIGRRLLQEAQSIASAAGRDALRLDAYEGEAGAAGFYERCGFREVGRVTYRGTRLVYFEFLL